jgi:hypothetical protein
MTTINIVGWSPGFQTVSAIQLLADKAQLGLSEAKRQIERLLSGESIHVEINTGLDATTLVTRLVELGAIVDSVDPKARSSPR